MPRKTVKIIPTDEEIASYTTNVPVDVAAQYLGFSCNTMYYALQDRRAPFGFAVPHESDITYSGFSHTYHISAAKLIGYQRDPTPLSVPDYKDVYLELAEVKRLVKQLLNERSKGG